MSVPSGPSPPLIDLDLPNTEVPEENTDEEAKPISDQLDQWYLDLKKNLLKEFDHLRLQYLEEAEKNTSKEKEIQAKDLAQLQDDVKTMREILIRYERVTEQKEQTEQNLCKAVDLLYQKTIAYQWYYQWRLVYLQKRREHRALALARHYYAERMKRKIFSHWKLFIEREWKRNFQLTYEKKSETVLNELIQDYEMKYQDLQLKVLAAQNELTRLRTGHVDHDESVRQAFMRGVCALNMEAMGVLLKNEHPTVNTSPSISIDHEHCYSKYPSHVPKEHRSYSVHRHGESRSVPKSRQMFVEKATTSHALYRS